ncbi:MAG: MmgE/PrpD family protein [Betaproteobacteria bacterium]|nr:MmgE/PrpD family protein [Betaproteobacteria bacterium]
MKVIDISHQGATAQFGAWAAALRYETIPADVIEHAKLCLLDGLGCGLFGSTRPWGKISADLARDLSGGGKSTLWGTNDGASPADAALANGTALHGFEIDDIHLRAMLHPGAVTIPAALALAEATATSGRELLTAIVAGYEIGCRVGICAGTAHTLRGYHSTGTVGCIGSAAAGASLLHLGAQEAMHALAIAATQAGGLHAGGRGGAMAKRFHAGAAARNGVVGALLAEKGFTGSHEALEAASGGFMSTLSDSPDMTPYVATLGSEWEILQTGFKAYAACASAHTTIDGIDAMLKRGLRADNLDHMRIHMSAVGHYNVAWPYRPTAVVGAQMNGYFAAAVKLLDGDNFIDQYTEDRIADPKILEMIKRIEIVHDAELDRGGAAKRHAIRIFARTRDGRDFEEYVEQRKGSAQFPLTREEIERKFRRTAGAVLSPSRTDQLLNSIFELEAGSSVTELSKALRVSTLA